MSKEKNKVFYRYAFKDLVLENPMYGAGLEYVKVICTDEGEEFKTKVMFIGFEDEDGKALDVDDIWWLPEGFSWENLKVDEKDD